MDHLLTAKEKHPGRSLYDSLSVPVGQPVTADDDGRPTPDTMLTKVVETVDGDYLGNLLACGALR